MTSGVINSTKLPNLDPVWLPPSSRSLSKTIKEAERTLIGRVNDYEAAFNEHRTTLMQKQEALDADSQALADAVRAGKPEPKTNSHYDAWMKEAFRLERRRDGLAQAVRDEYKAFADLVQAERAELLKTTEADEEAIREKFTHAVQAVADEWSEFEQAVRIGQWAHKFPSRPHYFMAGARNLDLPSANGEGIPVDAALEALKALVVVEEEPKTLLINDAD